MSTKRKELVMDTIFIAPLEQLGREDLDWAGGKGANLGELVKAGFPVPKGFVVTTDAYDYMLEITGLGRTIAAMLEEGLTAGAAIREAFMAADVPPEIDQEIAEVYGDLLGAVAVRSSATAEDLTTMPWMRLIGIPREALDTIQPITDLRIAYLPRAGLAMLRLFLVLKLLGRGELFGDLILGAPTQTGAANRALESLAERVRNDPKLQKAFAELESDRLTDAAKGDPGFSADLAAFLARYGHRESATPILVTPPTWGEAPETVLGLVKMLAANPPSTVPADRVDQALKQLLATPLLRGPRMRARLRRLVEAARNGIAFREDSHFYFTKPLPILRRSLLEIGRRLCDAGVLREPQEVFHLRLEELEAIADIRRLAEPDAERLRAAVRTRSARREELSGVPLIDPGLIFPPGDKGSDALVSGTPASGGTATGPVCVISEPAEFAKLSSGDILVCPYTNPAWTPLFQRAAAVVVDSGAIGSHAAIVAREYGIPAIMGTGVGTTELKDGQLVSVDGDRGLVSGAAPQTTNH